MREGMEMGGESDWPTWKTCGTVAVQTAIVAEAIEFWFAGKFTPAEALAV
jgi:hypothetical protein